jgi:hypothetical protein
VIITDTVNLFEKVEFHTSYFVVCQSMATVWQKGFPDLEKRSALRYAVYISSLLLLFLRIKT